VLGEGPTGEAFTTRRPVLVPDLSARGTRWLQLAAAADSHGVGGIYAFPMQLGGVRSGVLTVYCRTGHHLDRDELLACVQQAETARDLLLGALDHGVHGIDRTDGVNGVAGLSASAPLRTVVYQAQGMLMVSLGLSLADALTRLRAMAYVEGVEINQLAAELVAGDRMMPTAESEAQ
jgi:hypothetical protein